VRHWTKATGGGAWDASRYRGFGRAMFYCRDSRALWAGPKYAATLNACADPITYEKHRDIRAARSRRRSRYRSNVR